MSGDRATDDPEADHANLCMLWLCRRCGTLHGRQFSDQPADKNASTQSGNFTASPFQSEFGEIVQCDRTNDLQTLCANFVHRISRGVPRGIIEIYDVDRRNPNGV